MSIIQDIYYKHTKMYKTVMIIPIYLTVYINWSIVYTYYIFSNTGADFKQHLYDHLQNLYKNPCLDAPTTTIFSSPHNNNTSV